MVYVTKKISFSASHRLYNPELSENDNFLLYGKCGRSCTHGHNYVLEVTVCGKINPQTGMVTNVVHLKDLITERIINQVDHTFLNKDVPFLAGVIPSMENLVVEFWKMLEGVMDENCKLYRIKLFETENNFVEFLGN